MTAARGTRCSAWSTSSARPRRREGQRPLSVQVRRARGLADGALAARGPHLPVDDAVNTLEAALAQAGHRPSRNDHVWREEGRATVCQNCREALTLSGPGPDCFVHRPRRNLNDLARQCYAGFALDLSATWGFKVDQAAVDALVQKYGGDRERDKQPVRRRRHHPRGRHREPAVLKKLVAIAYGAPSGAACCATAPARSRVPKTEGRTKINCADCDGTALLLTCRPCRAPRRTRSRRDATSCRSRPTSS
jgi:hypothetical protein